MIKLNISAATKAKISTAYESAVKYTAVALEMLQLLQKITSMDCWEYDYDLVVSIYLLYSDCFYLHSRYLIIGGARRFNWR